MRGTRASAREADGRFEPKSKTSLRPLLNSARRLKSIYIAGQIEVLRDTAGQRLEDNAAKLGTANGDGENVYEMDNYEGTGSEPSPHGMVEDGELMDTIPTMRARCGARLLKQSSPI